MVSIEAVRNYLNALPDSVVSDATIQDKIIEAETYVNDNFQLSGYWKDRVITVLAAYKSAIVAFLYDNVKVGDLSYSRSVDSLLENLRKEILFTLKVAGIKRAKIETTSMFDDRPTDPNFTPKSWIDDYVTQ